MLGIVCLQLCMKKAETTPHPQRIQILSHILSLALSTSHSLFLVLTHSHLFFVLCVHFCFPSDKDTLPHAHGLSDTHNKTHIIRHISLSTCPTCCPLHTQLRTHAHLCRIFGTFLCRNTIADKTTKESRMATNKVSDIFRAFV